MLLSHALKDKIMDVRLRDKFLAEGRISPKEIEAYLKGLDDDGSNLSFTATTAAAGAAAATTAENAEKSRHSSSIP